MHTYSVRRPLDGPNLHFRSYMRSAFNAEALLNIPSIISDYTADSFEPVSTPWKYILSLPDLLKVHTVLLYRTKGIRFQFAINSLTICCQLAFSQFIFVCNSLL
jgi:hypothetical protein